MAQTLYLNVLDPQYTRYVQLGEELKQSLIEMYGDEIDFQICHESDRWTFYAPDELDRDEIRRLSKEVVKRKKRAAAAAGGPARQHGSQR